MLLSCDFLPATSIMTVVLLLACEDDKLAVDFAESDADNVCCCRATGYFMAIAILRSSPRKGKWTVLWMRLKFIRRQRVQMTRWRDAYHLTYSGTKDA